MPVVYHLLLRAPLIVKLLGETREVLRRFQGSIAAAHAEDQPVAGCEVDQGARQNRQHVRHQMVHAQPPDQDPHDHQVPHHRERTGGQVEPEQPPQLEKENPTTVEAADTGFAGNELVEEYTFAHPVAVGVAVTVLVGV